MIEKGKIVINIVAKGKEHAVMLISKKGKEYKKIAPAYEFQDLINGRDCEVEIVDDQIVKIIVEGTELPRKFRPEKKENSKSFSDQSVQSKQIPDSFNYNKAYLPKDTRALGFTGIDNFYLKLNKVARFEIDKFEFFKTEKGKVLFKIQPYYGDLNFPNLCNRYKERLKKLEQLRIKIKSLRFEPTWRCIIGLGNESIYETGITLHHIYGFPYIPGSAIKGILRSWIIEKIFNKNVGNKNDGAYKDEGFCRIFGSPKDSAIGEHAGSVHFFDAYPTKEPKIEPDVMNPHYSPYYTEDKPPADYHNPVPIFFLTVKDATFEVIFGIKKKDNHDIYGEKINGNPLELVQNWLPNALSEHGLGAKTAVGYGYFKEIKEITNTL